MVGDWRVRRVLHKQEEVSRSPSQQQRRPSTAEKEEDKTTHQELARSHGIRQHRDKRKRHERRGRREQVGDKDEESCRGKRDDVMRPALDIHACARAMGKTAEEGRSFPAAHPVTRARMPPRDCTTRASTSSMDTVGTANLTKQRRMHNHSVQHASKRMLLKLDSETVVVGVRIASAADMMCAKDTRTQPPNKIRPVLNASLASSYMVGTRFYRF